jgi:hypothetical protein
MNKLHTILPRLAAFGLFAVAVIVPATPARAELAAHRAIYSLKLSEAKSHPSLVDVQGAMISVMEKSCDGWMLAQSLKMDLYTAEGRMIKQNMDFAGWEGANGKSYRFVARNQSGGIDKSFRGKARVQVGSPGKAIFRTPENKKITLPEGTMFPIGHMAWLIEQARAGVRQAPRFLFDGTDGTGAQEVDTFIGRKVSPADRGQDRLGPLTDQAGWIMRMAFYPVGGRKSVPEYEIEVLQLENGVAPRMTLDYENFSIIMELKKIEAVPAPDC